MRFQPHLSPQAAGSRMVASTLSVPVWRSSTLRPAWVAYHAGASVRQTSRRGLGFTTRVQGMSSRWAVSKLLLKNWGSAPLPDQWQVQT